ncbi:MAG: DUF6485 family protein [Candidatus Omnitrophica bacterium]|nr:DUF6485 family protein [Candidatus Omnitrophota bacterium]
MECTNIKKNREACNCTYSGCSRKGKCCECLQYHRQSGELPACFFSKEDERTYDRSVRRFIQAQA